MNSREGKTKKKEAKIATNYDVIVVGGGASGMMAAITAAKREKKVLLLEKNRRLGEKLRITGGGRCNVTNAEYDEHALLAKYGKSEQFLYSAFSQFGVKDTFAFFEVRGLPLVVEEKKRAFPTTQKAADVCRVLEQALTKAGVEVRTATPVLRIETGEGKIAGVAVKEGILTADAYVLATGGVSHPETGSTGDGFEWLRALGHTVVAPSPEIVPLATKEKWSHMLRGVSITSAKIHFLLNGKRVFSKEGPILFTHFGVSGPTILNSSGRVADLLQEGEVSARIDCFPQLDEGALEAHILEVFDSEKNKLFKNVFRKIAPVGMHAALLMLLPQINPEKKVHSITKEERKAVVKLLKALPLSITGLLGLNRAVVADGGVVLEEVDMKSMRSTLFLNLYLTGDLLHIRRPSGGYSLQLCWSSGFVAGVHA